MNHITTYIQSDTKTKLAVTKEYNLADFKLHNIAFLKTVLKNKIDFTQMN